MVNIETPEMTDKDREAAVEIMVDYRRGLRNLKTAALALHQKTGILPEFGEIILQNMKRDNVTQIRGYSKEPEQMRKGKEGKPNEIKRT
jgi:hypothetical protein